MLSLNHNRSDRHTELGLGWVPSEDKRDRRYMMRVALNVLEKDRRYYRYYFTGGDVLNQGNTPQCVGYSWKAFLLTSPLTTHGGPSSSQIYHEAQKVDQWPGNSYAGTSVRAGAKALQSRGHIRNYLWAWDVSTIADWVLNGHGPVVVGSYWYTDMFTPDEDGFVYPSGSLAGGHAYLIVGCNRHEEKFRCINSWGRGWGQSGRFWISFYNLSILLERDGEACTAIEKPVPGVE